MIRWCQNIQPCFSGQFASLILLLFICLSAQSQTFLSRDNHSGLTTFASSWTGQAPVVTNEMVVTNSTMVVMGYLVHGTDWSRANATFDGATATIVVEDTLRIHGNLTMMNGSSIHIKPGGVLIVHMAYNQDADAIFKNEGKAIFLDTWTTMANPTATTNTGSMYVAGAVTAGGSSITIKPYNDLPADSPDLYEFSRNKVIKAEDCAGTNNGNVNFFETGATILHWEKSTDLFRTKEIINNQTGDQAYSNLTETTSYRAWYRNSSMVKKYSSGSTYMVPVPAEGGVLSGTTAVCEGSNNVNLSLQDYIGEIVQWESSTTEKFKIISSSTLSSSPTFSFSDLTRKMYYRVLVKSGTCSQTYSAVYAVDYFTKSTGGTLSGSTTVCKGSNSGNISLSGHTGNVVRWESSSASDFTSPAIINSTAAEISYQNVSATTYYRAVVKNGPCIEAYSTTATITVSEVAGGTLAGSQPFCTGDAGATLTLSGYTGSILQWESSTDDFLTYQEIAHTAAELVVPAPVYHTKYRVLIGNGGICTNIYSAEFELEGNPSLNGGVLARSKILIPVVDPSESFPLSGNADNATGNGNDGIVLGAVQDYDRFGMAGSSYSFDGVDDIIATTTKYLSPGLQVFTISIWFKTTETSGGKLIGFGDSQTGWSNDYDRHIYMDDQGQLYFGVYTDGNASGAYGFVQTPERYNDGMWHQATGLLSAAGLELYVDGELKVKDETITVAQEFDGFWRLGGGSMGGWPEAPTHPMFEGQLDDVLIYSKALSQAEIVKLYEEGTNPFCEGETVSLQAAKVPGATYTWAGPNGFSSALQNPSVPNITSVKGGTYFVEIDLNGCITEGSTGVTVTPLTVAGNVGTDQPNVCSGVNSGTLSLTDYTGQVIRWESSVDDFKDDILVINQTQDQLTFTNITATTSFRAIVKSGDCGVEMASAAAKVVTDAPTVGGTISGSAEVCKGNNSGTLELTGHSGNIIHWEAASDENFENVNIISSASTSLTFEDLPETTWFRAKVKGGTCAEAYSTPARVEVSEVTGGSLTGTAAVCEGSNSGTITLSGHIGEVIRWESSVDNFQTTQLIANTTAQLSYSNLEVTTSYRAIIGNGGICNEMASSTVQITVDLQVAGGIIVSGQSMVCAGNNSGTLNLQDHGAEVVRWESSVDNFETVTAINNTTASHEFENLTTNTAFRAIVANGACGEAASEASTIEVVPVSQGGSITGSAEVCKGSNNGTLVLSGFTGEIIHWESAADAGFSSINTIQSLESKISYLNLSATTWYRAVVESGPCGTAYSAAAVITVSEVAGGLLSGSRQVCSGSNSGVLNLSGHSGNIIRWEKSTDNFVLNVQSVNQTGTELSFLNLTESLTYRAVIGNDVCAPVYSETALITVEPATAGGKVVSDRNVVCAGENSFTLYLQGFTGEVLRWERSADGFAGHKEVINHTLAELSVNNLMETGSYRAVVRSGSCAEEVSEAVRVVAEKTATGGIIAGSSRVKPGENAGRLELQAFAGTILHWESSTDNFVKDIRRREHTGTVLAYENIEVTTWYRVVVTKNTCGPVFSDVAVLTINQAPVAGEDNFEITAGEIFTSDISLLDNDTDPDQDLFQIKPVLSLQTQSGNEVDIDASGMVTFRPQEGFVGTDSIRYELCDIAGEASLCSSGLVVFNVKEKTVPQKEIFVYKGLSPNQDHKNDKWYIENIEYFPANHVRIYNANGILVYETEGYDNADNAFAGIGNRGSGSSGKELPEATYYYRIYFTESQTDLKGYVILNR